MALASSLKSMDQITLAFGDIHAPYHWSGALDYIADQIRHYANKKIKLKIVFMGDEMDAHAFGRWPNDPDLDGPGLEWTKGVAFMKQLYKVAPRAQVCMSNHTYRPWIQASTSGIPSRFMLSLAESLEAPKTWSWHDEINICGVKYIHGMGFSGQVAHIKAVKRHFQSVVIGHIHAFAGVNYIELQGKSFFGANAGCLIDQKALAFAYAKNMPEKASIGHLEVINGKEAHFYKAQ